MQYFIYFNIKNFNFFNKKYFFISYYKGIT